MIGKGCTCRNTFSFPFKESDVEAIRISYSQNGEILFQKEIADSTFSDGAVSVNLTQEETLKFNSYQIIEIQLKVKLVGGVVVKSKIIKTVTDEVLCCEVI